MLAARFGGRFGRGALVALLAGAAAALCAQTPAASRQQADRQFLQQRGLLPSSKPASVESGLATRAAFERLEAVRARQGATRAARQPSIPDGTAQPALNSDSTVWQSAGPVQLSTPSYGLVTGRISSLAADPTNRNILYLGATGGGVWKSTNAAGPAGTVTFQPLTDDLPVFANSQISIPSLSIGALSVQPGNPNVLLAGTGDPNDALDSYYGVGILRSNDGGTTWSLYQQSRDTQPYRFKGTSFAGFAWSTTAPNLVVAAVSQSKEASAVGADINPSTVLVGSMAGLYYSSDAGVTWYLATITDGPNSVVQSSTTLGGAPPGNAATSVVWNATRRLFFAAVRSYGYYSSADGITWTRLSNQPGANLSSQSCTPGNCPIFRGVLAVQPVTGDTFALTSDLNNKDEGLYQDVCSTSGLAVSSCASSTVAFGKQINDAALDDANGKIPQADYNLALSAVSSQQDTLLFAGTEDIFRCSLANSCQWRNTTTVQTFKSGQVAPSTHAIEGTYGANGLLFFGNDGGLWRTTDGLAQTGSVGSASDASHFDNLNGGIGSLAEITHLAVSPTNGSLVLAGMGEFGIVASESAAAQGGTGAWQQLLTGEGSQVAIDPTNPSNWYADAGGGLAIFSCPNGVNCNPAGFGTGPTIGRSQVADDTDSGLEPAPWILDPGNPANILVGTCRMWLGPATGGWNKSNLLSGMLDGDQEPFCNGNGQLRSVGAGGSYNGAGERMYAGMAGFADGGASVPGHLYGATVPQSGGQLAWADLWRNPVTNTSQSSQFNPSGYAISSIAVDPHDATGRTVYAGVAGVPMGTGAVLYGSTDGGAHWANLTNSLPHAPVNSVVVDPNNAGYVYVGGDFGVYVTTDITKCYGTFQNFQNCWTELGSGLPNAPVTDLKVYSSGSTTVLEAATYGRGIWTLGLTTNPLIAQGTLSPAGYNFPAQAVGSPGAPVPFTLSNTGSVALAIAEIATTPGTDYTQTNNCGASLAAGANCTILVTFTPSVTADRPGMLIVRANTRSGTLSSALDGTGLTPGVLSVSPTSLAFPTTTIGTTANLNLILKNTGGAPLTLGARTFSGANSAEFNLSAGSTCVGTLAAGASCTVPVGFNPAGSNGGTRTALLAVASSSSGSPATVSLSGNAVTPASLSLTPSSLPFPDTTVGTPSAAKTVTVTNSGGTAASLDAPTASPSDYSLSTNCGATLAPNNGSCTIQVFFTPTASGSRNGLLTLPSSSAPGGQLTVSLNGMGLAAASLTLSPGSLTFPAQTQGTTSAAQSVTVTNAPGGSAAQLGTPTATGDYAVTSTCPATLPASQHCTLSITFTPTMTGQRTGTLSVPYTGSPAATASLSGTGVAPGALSFNPSVVSFPVTADNATSAQIPVTITNSGGSPASISSVATSAPFAITGNTCPVAPATLAVNGTCTLNITFTPPGTASYTGSVTLTGSFSNSPAAISLSGQGAMPPAATLTPGSLSFPDTVQGAVSAPQSFTVTSTGDVPVMLGSPSVSTAEYQIAGNNCPASLAPNATCSIGVLFHPSGTESRSATFLLPGNVAGGSLRASLTGNGLPPGTITLTPLSIDFGAQFTGTTSAAQSVTVSNTGDGPVTVGTPSTTGDYAVAGSCPNSLPAGGSCTLSVTFTPSAIGNRPGRLTVPWGSGSSTTTTLDGMGTTPGQLVFSPSPLSFSSTAIGSSTTSSVTVTSQGGTAVQFSGISVTGDFAVGTGGTCTSSTQLAAGSGSCTVTVVFTPTTTGSRTGTLTIANNGVPASATEPLNGTGVKPGYVSFSPAGVNFGSVVLNASATQAFTATNSGGVAVSLGTPLVSGSGYRLSGSDCVALLSPGSSCTVQVVFSPAKTGEVIGTLSLPWGSSSTATAALDGVGVTPGALTFSPDPVAFGATVIQTTATQSVTVQNTGGAPVPLGLVKILGGFAVTSQCTGTLAPNAVCTLQISFAPASQGPVGGLLTVFNAGGSSSWSEQLSGNGVQPGSLTVSPGSLTFGATVKGSRSAPQTATFYNPGGVPVALNPPQVSSSDYAITPSETNPCGASLAAGASCIVSVAFTPQSPGDRPATLTLASSANGGPSAKVALTGSGLRPAQLVFSPPSLAFGGVFERSVSPAQTLTLVNGGDVATSLAPATLTGQYSISANSCTGLLGAGASCRISIQFEPVSTGAQPASLSIASPTGTPSAAASLSGTGLALELSPTGYAFTPSLAVGSPPSSHDIAIENHGTTPMTLQLTLAGSDFKLGKSSCPTGQGLTLPPDTSCAVEITFTPSIAGLRTGTLVVSGGGETESAQLSGTGLSPATDTLSSSTLVFPLTVAGKASPEQALTLTNTGDATLEQISTAGTRHFVVKNYCGSMLGGHKSCAIAVSFTPSDIGPVSETLLITDAQRTQSVSLSGQGAPPPQASALPVSLDFGPYALGMAAPAQTVTISNLGKTSLDNLTFTTTEADFTLGPPTGSSPCGSSLAAGASCQVGVVFTPGAIGTRQATLSVNSPALQSPLIVGLAGSGEDYQLSPYGGTTVVLTSGQTATYRFALTPTGDSAGNITLSCSGAPVHSACTVNPTVVQVGQGVSGSLQLTVATGVATQTASSASPFRRWWPAGSALALLCPVLLMRGDARRRLLMLMIAAMVTMAPLGCGVHASGVNSASGNAGAGGASGSVTPRGTYTLTMKASYPGAQRTIAVTLIVE